MNTIHTVVTRHVRWNRLYVAWKPLADFIVSDISVAVPYEKNKTWSMYMKSNTEFEKKVLWVNSDTLRQTVLMLIFMLEGGGVGWVETSISAIIFFSNVQHCYILSLFCNI